MDENRESDSVYRASSTFNEALGGALGISFNFSAPFSMCEIVSISRSRM